MTKLTAYSLLALLLAGCDDSNSVGSDASGDGDVGADVGPDGGSSVDSPVGDSSSGDGSGDSTVKLDDGAVEGSPEAAPDAETPEAGTVCKATAAQVTALKTKVKHIVVIYQENWSYDSLWGNMPGTENLSRASAASKTQIQVDPTTGAPTTAYPSLPQPRIGSGLDDAFNGVTLTNAPYDLSPYHPGTALTGDIIHRFWTNKRQIGSGATANTQMVAWSDNPGLVMSYYDGSSAPLGVLAKRYTVADHFFQAAYGGSYLNHQFLIAAAPGTWTDNSQTAGSLGDGHVVAGSTNDAGVQGSASIYDKALLLCTTNCTPAADGKYYAVNTIQPVTPPHVIGSVMLPLQTNKTIGDLLEDAPTPHTWAWFAGGWDNANAAMPLMTAIDAGEAGADSGDEASVAEAGQPDGEAGAADAGAGDASATDSGPPPPNNFQYHHQPFNYFERWSQGSDQAKAERAAHLKDETALNAILADVTTADAHLPDVSFVKFYGDFNEHPGYATFHAGEQHAADLINTILSTAGVKDDTLVVVTYDEFGGRWDHVTPPTRDFWGPGTRIPATLIGAMVRKGDGTTPAVDSCNYDTTSILKLIEQRFDLPAINAVDGNQNDLATDIVTP